MNGKKTKGKNSFPKNIHYSIFFSLWDTVIFGEITKKLFRGETKNYMHNKFEIGIAAQRKPKAI